MNELKVKLTLAMMSMLKKSTHKYRKQNNQSTQRLNKLNHKSRRILIKFPKLYCARH